MLGGDELYLPGGPLVADSIHRHFDPVQVVPSLLVKMGVVDQL